MVNAELNDIQAKKQLEALASLMVSHPDTRKMVKNIIRKELRAARSRISKDARNNLISDPRKAYLAVKTATYKQILGGNISILQPRKASGRTSNYVRPRKLDSTPNQRGGNRRPRSARTETVDGYYGKDRAFILRFVNDGTKQRNTRYGNRGSLRGNRWFEMSSTMHVDMAIKMIQETIEFELGKQYNKIIN